MRYDCKSSIATVLRVHPALASGFTGEGFESVLAEERAGCPRSAVRLVRQAVGNLKLSQVHPHPAEIS